MHFVFKLIRLQSTAPAITLCRVEMRTARTSALVLILYLLSLTSARPSSHFLHMHQDLYTPVSMNWAKDRGVFIRCITTFSATTNLPTTDSPHTDSQRKLV